MSHRPIDSVSHHIELPSFDSLAQLYQQNPNAFEALRLQILEATAAAAPEKYQPAMQYTLYRIQITREAAATPLEAAAAACRLMTESWGRLQDAMRHLQQEVAALQTVLVLERAMTRSRQEIRVNPLLRG